LTVSCKLFADIVCQQFISKSVLPDGVLVRIVNEGIYPDKYLYEMRKRLEQLPHYPFAWLDEITEVTLNPKSGVAGELQAEELYRLQDKIGTEVRQVLGCLKMQTFWIFSTKKKKAVLLEYDQAIRLLKQQAVFNLEQYPDNTAIKTAGTVIITCLDDLSHAIRKRYSAYLPDVSIKTAADPRAVPSILKIICDLSIDQIGIILKAADDTKLIISRSLSLVFKTIVPFLSTNNKEELSWDSVRSNSYHPEERDKNIAIAALEKLIDQIKRYN
jgi:hypothetical protein